MKQASPGSILSVHEHSLGSSKVNYKMTKLFRAQHDCHVENSSVNIIYQFCQYKLYNILDVDDAPIRLDLPYCLPATLVSSVGGRGRSRYLRENRADRYNRQGETLHLRHIDL